MFHLRQHAQIINFGVPGGVGALHAADCQYVVLHVVLAGVVLGQGCGNGCDDFAGVLFLVVVGGGGAVSAVNASGVPVVSA